jgi:hypothetical protein
VPLQFEGNTRVPAQNQKKSQQKPKATSSEAFAVEQAKMSEFSDASDNMKEISEIQEF